MLKSGPSEKQIIAAFDEDVYTGEINPSSFHPHNQSCPLRRLVDTTNHSTTTGHHLPDGLE
jgi:hypothetical protein